MNKCIVHGCANHEGEGGFVGVLCSPCHRMLTTGDVGLSRGQTFIHRLRDNLNISEVANAYLSNKVHKLEAARQALSDEVAKLSGGWR